MSWSNPTPDEAYESYTYYRNRYYDAAYQKSASEKRQQTYISQRNSERSKYNNLASQKLNLEKRLSAIESIIKMLEGTGGWRSTNVPDAILRVNSALNKADDAYRRSIKMDGCAVASLESVFSVPTVEGEHHSAAALLAYKAERNRLGQEISNLNTNISALSASISALNGKINSCSSAQEDYRRIMSSSAYEMNHFRKYMY